MLTPVPLVLRFLHLLWQAPETPMDLVVAREQDDEAQQLRDSFPSVAKFLERRTAVV